MLREKTELEKSERWRDQAKRLRHALFVIEGMSNLTEIKRVALCAMRGELHGHEMADPKREPGGYDRAENWPF